MACFDLRSIQFGEISPCLAALHLLVLRSVKLCCSRDLKTERALQALLKRLETKLCEEDDLCRLPNVD